MPSDKKPRSIVSRTDPLDTPYIADKLAKLQGVHEYTENLMNHLRQEKLAADGKRPERVRVTAKKPGPRTEEEKRKFYRARRLRPKAKPQPEFFTLAEAKDQLGFDSEKSVRRLIDAGKLDARKTVVSGKRRWVVDRVDINRYRLIERGWLKRQFSSVPPVEGYYGDLGTIHVYYRWGQTRGNSDRLRTYSLAVSIEDFWRFVCKVNETKVEYESVKAELQTRLPEKQENFQIRFAFNEQAQATLKRIIESVPPLLIRGEDSNVLKCLALEHLIQVTLPSLRRAKRSWFSYLRQSVRNFYKDKTRQDKKQFSAIGGSADADRLFDLSRFSDPEQLLMAQDSLKQEQDEVNKPVTRETNWRR